jgi:sensor histidine kinase YesM
MIAKAIKKDKYILSTVIISLAVAVLIHFPESVSLFDRFESHSLFPGMKFIDVANEILFTFLSLLLLFAINTRLFHFNQASIKITGTKILLSFIVTWILSNLSGQFFVFLHRTFDIPAIDAMVHHYLHPLRDFIITCTVSGSCYISYLIRRQQEVVIENQQLQAENILNQYEALKNQLNPHMLFNSLNTLRSLVREDQDKAQEYIQELSRVLRYTLQGNDSKSVCVKDEIEFVSAYIFLLKMRFEDNLSFDICIDNKYANYYLPPMAVQMLIENAVKHNEISDRHPLNIRIYTEGEELIVTNPVQPKLTVTTGTGIGLANLAKRYYLLYKREIQISENEQFTIRIPLIPSVS